jgi:hypothetical protein
MYECSGITIDVTIGVLMALTDLTSAMTLIALAALAAFRVSTLPTALSMALLPSMAPTPLMASTPSLALSS